ncbi:MAG TPA: Ig-like domain-containing protein [Thermoanaerobaculia bacterium]|nr:Ig-like domain-containing protein [Thermoanaerobaculia bacterium]
MFCRVLAVLFVAASALAQNQPPLAQPQTVVTNGTEPLEIILRGSDAEGRDLRFAITEPPAYGSVSDPEEIVPPAETDPRTGDPVQPPVTSARVVYRADKLLPDRFTFAVIDSEGASGVAVVTINPESEPPPPPVTTVIAHDTVAEVYRDTTATLTMTAAAPEGVSLTFALLSKPEKGEVGELAQNTISYTPARGYTGEDGFEFEACGIVKEKYVCDSATYRINVIERPTEPASLVSDVHVKTPRDREARISLEQDNRNSVDGKPITLRALVAGNVIDNDGDGRGDERDVPQFMSARVEERRVTRMHLEFDLRELEKVKIARAEVVLHTHRASKNGVETRFFAAGEGDGELAEKDFESEAEPIRGAVMPMPPLEQMPVGGEGTFSFDASGELKAAHREGLRVLALQGRVNEKSNGAGLEAREPTLIVTPAERPGPLTYTVESLPETGALFDAAGKQIREVPYRLPNGTLTYQPPKGYVGTAGFRFSATDGVITQLANAVIVVFFGRCAEDADYCNNGR